MKRNTEWFNSAAWVVAGLVLAGLGCALTIHGILVTAAKRQTLESRVTALEREVNALKGKQLAVVGPAFAEEQRILRNWCGKNQSDLNELRRAKTAKAVVALGGFPEPFREVER